MNQETRKNLKPFAGTMVDGGYYIVQATDRDDAVARLNEWLKADRRKTVITTVKAL